VTAPRILLQLLPGTRAEKKQQMRTRIETRRLVLRPFDPADVEAAFEWFGDPLVMRFTVTGPDKSIEQTRTRPTYFEKHQQTHGFSK
jgi:RimJ/RimL family protein N-acetyltransferase